MNTKTLLVALLITVLTSSLAMPCCYTLKRIHNDTGQDAWDFKIVLDGEYKVINWESSDFRQMEDVYVPSTNFTTIRFFDPEFPIKHCDWITIKYWLDKPAGNVSAVCWTDQNKLCINDLGLQVGHTVVPRLIFRARDDVILVLQNYLESGLPIRIQNLRYAVQPEELSLADLDPNMPELESAKSLDVLADGVVPSGGDMSLLIPETIGPNQALIYSFELVNEVGEVVAYEVGQHDFMDPDPPQPPTVSEWGLIIMALLLVTVGVIMIRKQRQVTA